MYEPTRPSLAVRSADFFSAFDCPSSASRAFAFSASPSAQRSALRTSDMPAPVASRRRLISSADGLYTVFTSFVFRSGLRACADGLARDFGVLLVVLGLVVRGLGL